MKATVCYLFVVVLTISSPAFAATAMSEATATMSFAFDDAAVFEAGVPDVDFPFVVAYTLGSGGSVTIEHCSGACSGGSVTTIGPFTSSGSSTVTDIMDGDEINVILSDSVTQTGIGNTTSSSAVTINILPGSATIATADFDVSGSLTAETNDISMAGASADSAATSAFALSSTEYSIFGAPVVTDLDDELTNQMPSPKVVSTTQLGPLADGLTEFQKAEFVGMISTEVTSAVSVPEPGGFLFLCLACVALSGCKLVRFAYPRPM